MRHLRSSIAVSVLTTGFAVEAAANQTDPLSVVQSLVEAMAAQDATTTEAAFTDDAGYAYSLDGTPSRGDGFDRWSLRISPDPHQSSRLRAHPLPATLLTRWCFGAVAEIHPLRRATFSRLSATGLTAGG